MGSSSSRDVHSLSDKQAVDKSGLQIHDRPLRNPPQIRRGVTVPPHLWVSELYRCDDSARHCRNPTYRPRSVPEDGTAEQLFAALETKLQQVRIEVDTVATALRTATTYVEKMEKERNDYKTWALRTEMRYSRMKKEWDRLRETGGTSPQEPRSGLPVPYPSPPLQGDDTRSSSAGPSRRDSTLKKRRQSWPLGNRRRSGSIEPSSTPSEEEERTSFAVTSIAPALPAETIYRRDGHCDKQYIRDASGSPRPAPAPYGRDEIGIHHVDLMYQSSVPGRISCRVCRRNEVDHTDFPRHAAWEELREHYMTQHPQTCQEIAKLTPDGLTELRRRGIVPK